MQAYLLFGVGRLGSPFHPVWALATQPGLGPGVPWRAGTPPPRRKLPGLKPAHGAPKG